MRQYYLILVLSILFSFSIFGQQTIKSLVNETMSRQRIGAYFDGIYPFKKYLSENPYELLKYLVPYRSDSSEKVRFLTYNLINKCGLNSNDIETRQFAVKNLVLGLRDRDASIRNAIYESLKDYQKNNFSEEIKIEIFAMLKENSSISKNIIKFIAYLEINNGEKELKKMVNTDLPQKMLWDIKISLIRLGDTTYIRECLELVKINGINDGVVNNLYPDLIFTRNKFIYNYLIEKLQSNEKNCNSPNPSYLDKISCAYKIMEYLTPVIKDFPLKFDGDKIITDNYNTALEIARNWFKNSNNNYSILLDSF